MKMFTKLALVSSMAISANAMAMQAMDDAALSSATGQDGISIGIALDTDITIDKLYIHDNDGLQTSTTIVGATGTSATVTSGAISIDGITVAQSGTGNLLDLVIDSDAGTGNTVGSGPNSTAFLNIAATVGAVDVSIGSIGVGQSGASKNAALTSDASLVTDVRRGVIGDATATPPTTTVNEIITGLDLSLGSITANIQLGSAPQGAMIKVDSTLSGLDITNLGIKDAAGGGTIQLGGIHVRGASGAAIDVDLDVNVTTAGLEVVNNSTAKNDVYIRSVGLGGASIGDVEIQGLSMGTSTITISGH
ncbi:DUF6160 family protein [Acinetobacter junii]|jgi:hypothetical protein|uniref:putative pilus system protein FilA n=1 Tax=Acinetobacter junii TaxID=40215 RepID=UPI00102E7A5F|nr:DUF6160 family protein [Acinetobacter junii]RZG68112.1 protein FilA [Acinetobacter junii]